MGSSSRRPSNPTLDDLNQPRFVGKHFTFFKFIDMIVKCAKVIFSGLSNGADAHSYSNYKNANLLEAEMLCLLLERLELSKGFNNLEKKTNKPHTSKITLLPGRNVIKHLSQAKAGVLGPESQDAVSSVTHPVMQKPPAPLPPKTRPSTSMPSQSIRAATIAQQNETKGMIILTGNEKRLQKLQPIIESCGDRLHRIFTFYCQFGEPLNTDKLRSTKFIKLLKDASLLEPKPDFKNES